MKYFLILAFCFFNPYANAQMITVPDVKVSVTAKSAAAAREKALDLAHSLAFQKLISENFPDTSETLPPHETIVNMVSDFSIDREKTTPTSYSASLTFQFDGRQVQAWIHKNLTPSKTTPSASLSFPEGGKSLKMTASYTTFPEWLHIKRTIEKIPGIDKVDILSLSPKGASIQVAYNGDVEKLQQHLLQQGLLLSPQEEGWLITSNSPLSQ